MTEQTGFEPSRVLFDSATSSARSQIAEAWLRFLGGDFYEVSSAGSQAVESLRPEVVSTMGEAGVVASRLRPAPFVSFLGQRFDYVVTIGEPPGRSHPLVDARKERLHWQIEDPEAVQQIRPDKQEALRRVREQIRERVADFVLSDPPALHRLLGERVMWEVLERLARGDRTLEELAATELGAEAVQARLRRLDALGLVRQCHIRFQLMGRQLV